MTGARIEVDDAAVQGAFAQLLALGADLTPTLDMIGQQLRRHVDERFRTESGPGGVPWKQSWRAMAEGGQTLTASTRLRGSITYEVGPTSVEIGTDVEYAAIHQFGGTIRAKTSKGLVFRAGKDADGKTAWRRMMSVTIPARPFLGFDAEHRAETLWIVQRDLALAAGVEPPAGGGAA